MQSSHGMLPQDPYFARWVFNVSRDSKGYYASRVLEVRNVDEAEGVFYQETKARFTHGSSEEQAENARRWLVMNGCRPDNVENGMMMVNRQIKEGASEASWSV